MYNEGNLSGTPINLMKFAEVAVNTAVNQTYHYHIPDKLLHRVTWGSLVRVGFGTAMQPAIVVELHDELPDDLQDITTKPIIELLHPEPVMTEEHIELGMWMSEAYLTSPGACLWLMLPPGLTGRSSRQVHLIDETAEGNSESQRNVLNALREKSPQKLSALKKVADVKNIQGLIRRLEEQGMVEQEALLSPPTASQKTVKTVVRAIPDDEIIDALAQLDRAPKQTKVFSYISRFDYPLDITEVREETDASYADLNALERKGFIQSGERIVYRDSLADRDFVPSKPLKLTSDQQTVWEIILQSLRNRKNNNSQLTEVPSPTLWGGDLGVGVSKPPQLTDKDSGEEIQLSFIKWANTYAPPKLHEKLKLRAQEMRKNPTPAEDKLWQALRGKKLNSIKFRRQHRIQRFIVDFYAANQKLVIEVDGESHENQVEYDEMRTAYLEYLGLNVLRFSNADVIQHLDAVLEAIGDYIDSTPTSDPSPEYQGGELDVAQDDMDSEKASQAVEVPSLTPWGGDLGEGVKESHSPQLRAQNAGEGVKGLNKFLLHGVTGSGKTEIYLHAIAEVIAQGRQAIFLVPEIALTPQTIRRVAQRFPNQVAVVHGSLGTGERYDTWRRAREGEINIIVGTRSALFTPLPDVGLIILDEEHDHSYKHAPALLPPYYHAREVAEKLADFNEATVILGSATPDIESFYRAQKGELQYLHMPARIMGHRQRIEKQAKKRGVKLAYQALNGDSDAMTIDLPPVTIVDMREELKAGNRSMFSRDLKLVLKGVIERNEQAILFLNRRGQASYVFCRDCGYVVECDNCDTPMTYHRHGDLMRCHHCGHRQESPEICPECGSDKIRFFGAGTQQVEQALHKEFPEIRTVRWDRDTADKPDLHEMILAKFAGGDADIMVGTQMIAKGLDLPLVTLVGVISADPGLALPDFRARERAFQILTQVAGRAGRGILGGQVIIQTYNPQHPSIMMAGGHDYEGFYDLEIESRREMGYPPYRRLARILVQNAHPIEAQRQIESAAEQLKHFIDKHNLTDTHLIGPAPCFFSRIDRLYRWQVLIRSTNPNLLLQHIQIRNGWYIDIDPVDIL